MISSGGLVSPSVFIRRRHKRVAKAEEHITEVILECLDVNKYLIMFIIKQHKTTTT